MYLSLHVQVSGFGIDYEGPMSSRSDDATVQLDDPHPMLSVYDKEQLSRISSDMELESPDQEDNWLGQYAVARSFIHSVV